ncbi:LysR family transcriptional regulator substrate-binding protein [Nesterenkonia sp.]|uniref:LysR family transcriptional regulator substrate-binding protein n=1 Tax=Nesterenkonia sp. TaxID=704201 RepID=UPI0026310030|nr:LysR family transcriptional regulator substrate-binding protein [Nesterenkonia sp.]
MSDQPSPQLRLGAIPGATPDKWAARWRERFPGTQLHVDYYDDAGVLQRLRASTVDLSYLRLPAEAESQVPEDVHRVWLYTEETVVCAAAEHWIAAADAAVAWEEIAEENFLDPAEMIRPWEGEPQPHRTETDPGPETDSAAEAESEMATDPGPGAEPSEVHHPKSGAHLARAERLAVEVAASGAGLVLLPASVARMLSRKDVVIRSVDGLAGHRTGLAWLRERDDEQIQEFIGIARGRRAGSPRSAAGSPRSASGAAPGSGSAAQRKSRKNPGMGKKARSGRAGSAQGRPRSRRRG